MTEAVIPLASVLMTKGMGTGAVMALIIGSAGANLTEVILLKSMFRTPMIVAFLTVILGMAVMMGYLTQLLFERKQGGIQCSLTKPITTAIGSCLSVNVAFCSFASIRPLCQCADFLRGKRSQIRALRGPYWYI